jgi:arachidonate 15-lipoxygenase
MTADANASAVYFHHARTHMVIEPIVVSISRQLAPSHPLRVLLSPHFIGTLAINRTGQVTVFAPGGLIEKVGAATRPTFRSVAIDAVKTQSVRALALRRSLGDRGVADSSVLRDFAYRDDALLVWDALESWVRDYVDVYYESDAEVLGDEEMRAFLAEVEAPTGGRLHDVGPLSTRDDLVEFLTIVIFTASAQHWALNGPLATWMTFAPNYPLALWEEPRPTPAVGDWIDMMPPLEMAQQQLEAAYGMGATRYNILGSYEEGTFADPRIQMPLAAFRERLVALERLIVARNRVRTTPYELLLPSLLPASINI